MPALAGARSFHISSDNTLTLRQTNDCTILSILPNNPNSFRPHHEDTAGLHCIAPTKLLESAPALRDGNSSPAEIGASPRAAKSKRQDIYIFHIRMNALVLYGVAGVLLGILTHVFANPSSVVLVDLKAAMLNERQICSPGVIKCKNASLTCNDQFWCEYINTPLPSYTIAMQVAKDQNGNIVQISHTPSRTPTPTPSPITSAMAGISPFIHECNSCFATFQCIAGRCHDNKCVLTGHQEAGSLHKCFGIPIPSATPKPSMLPVVLSW